MRSPIGVGLSVNGYPNVDFPLPFPYRVILIDINCGDPVDCGQANIRSRVPPADPVGRTYEGD